MSLLYSAFCLAICGIAVARLNSLGHESALLKRVVLVLIAVGALGGVMRPFVPPTVSSLYDAMFAGGVMTSMIVRYYRPAWYADRGPSSHETFITRLLDRVK